MRSRSNPPPPHVTPTGTPQPHGGGGGVAERAGRRTRATRQTPSASTTALRRARRGMEPPRSPMPPMLPELPAEVLSAIAPEELYRREKARRATTLDSDVMIEARRILAEQMEASGKKRGVTITPRGRPPKPKPKPDDWDLEEYGEDQVLGRAPKAGADDE